MNHADGIEGLFVDERELLEEIVHPTRRLFLQSLGGAAVAAAVGSRIAHAQADPDAVNFARVATGSSSHMASENKISSLNDEVNPASSFDHAGGMFVLYGGHGPDAEPAWVEYAWPQPVTIDRVDIYWGVDKPKPGAIPGSSSLHTVQLPQKYSVRYWNGSAFVSVKSAEEVAPAVDRYNSTTFEPVTTDRLRIEVISQAEHAAGILEWRVLGPLPVSPLEPAVQAGVDRSVILGGQTYLNGKVRWLQDSPKNSARWSTVSGPGRVTFADASSPVTRASFSAPGDYLLALAAAGSSDHSHAVAVRVEPAPPRERLDVVYTRRYSLDSPFWGQRAKALIVNWIPHCIQMCERTDIAPMRGDGGIDNFVEAGKALRGEPHGPHKGYVFSNAWVHQTVESMCIALMVDSQGDAEIEQAQSAMRATLERWIPIILAAQMPDGYLQTAYTLAERSTWPERWSPDHRGNHEGYVAGYFIESAINHYTLTDGRDLRLYNAARKLADCWVANIGPGKKEWFDGHQEMEQALVRFGRFVNDQEGNGRGDAYIALARFLLDSRRGGSEYDQSHLPPEQQYEAVGHAVRAMYFYSGMADIAAETHDRDYQSAVISLWDNMVNRKYYLTGGIGSGETSEGFGPNYSLRNDAYCETCSSCGVVFFQYKLNLAYHDARFVDLYEQTMYNALLGGVALDGNSFCYTNPLVNTERAKWHVCPCCVGNLARTLLMVPTWSYAKSHDGLYVNMFVGSRVNVGHVGGTEVEVIQKTDYPWHGSVAIVLNPAATATFSLHVRIPDRHTSKLYTESPQVRGLLRIAVNGETQTPLVENGYAVLTRAWQRGDRVELELPMTPQRVVADRRVQADSEHVAVMRGPLVYNVEATDNGSLDRRMGDAPLQSEWRPDLLGGVMVVKGEWSDHAPLLAIPNYARMNRQGAPAEYPREDGPQRGGATALQSKVWI